MRSEIVDDDDGLVGLGRRQHDRAVGALPGLRRPAGARRVLADDGGVGRTSPHGSARTVATPSRRGAARRSRRRTSASSGTAGSTGASGSNPTADESRGPVDPDKGDVGTAFLHRSASLAARHRPAARPRRARPNGSTSWRPTSSRPGAPSSSRPDGSLTPDTQANHVRALAFGLVPDEPPARDRGPTRRADPSRRHPPRHRVPRHAVPAPGPRRHRPPRRGLRAAPAGHAAVVAAHGRPRRHHRVGGVGGHRRRTASPKDSLNHYSKGAVISFLHRYIAGIQLARRRARLPSGSASHPARVAASPGPRPCTTPPTAASSRRGASTKACSG